MKQFISTLAMVLLYCISLNANESQYSAPSNLYASSIYYNDAILNWSASTLAQKWIVSYNTSGSTSDIQMETTLNHIQINNLVSGLVYNWKVRMVDTNGDTTTWSNTEIFQTLTDTSFCGVVSNLTIDAMNSNGITVQWAADTNQTQWQLVYGDIGSNPEIDGIRQTLSNYYYTIPSTTISLGSWYQIAVRSVCSEGYGAWSFINTRYISSVFDSLPMKHTFEQDNDNNSSLTTSFGFVSGIVNPWVIDTAYNATTPLEDCSHAMYISSTGGRTNDYYPYKSTISYAYIDVFVPQEATSFYLDFKYLCKGQGLTDGLKVYLLSDQTALDIKQLPSQTYQIGNSIYNGNDSSFQSVHIELPVQYVGRVRRVVFAWVNDSTGGGEGGAVIDDIYITARYCSTPSGLSHNYVSSSSALLSWSLAEGQNLFNIEYRPVNSYSWNLVSGVTNNYLLTGLQDNTLYYYRVQAACSEEESFFSDVDTFTTLITCLPPENLHLTYYTNAAAIVAWNSNTSVRNWILEYGIDLGENTTYYSHPRETNNDTLLFLLPNTTYRVRVKAVSLQGDTSSYSSILLIHTLCNVVEMYPFFDLPSPANYTSSASFEDSIMCWEEKGDTLLSPPMSFLSLAYPQLSFNYLLKDSTASASSIKILTTINNAISFAPLATLPLTSGAITAKTFDLSLFAGETIVRLAFVIQHSNSSSTVMQLKDFVIQDICKSPQTIFISNITPFSAKADWTPYANNVGWRIGITDLATTDTSFYLVQSNPVQIEALAPSHTYKIMVQSVCAPYAMEDFPTEATFTTLQQMPCSSPTNLTCYHYTDSTKGNETVVCSWNGTTSQNIYELQYKEKYAVNWNSISVSGVTHYNVRNLNLETIYQFRVRTICDSVTMSDFSDTAEVSLSSVSDISTIDKTITLYPMPVSKILNIDFSYPNFGTTVLVNQEGQTIKKWQKLPNKIDMSKLAKGVYYLQIKAPNSYIQKKVIVN